VAAHAEHTQPPQLDVTVMFEPSRLTSTCLAHAYERIVPLVRRVVPAPSPARPASSECPQESVAGAR